MGNIVLNFKNNENISTDFINSDLLLPLLKNSLTGNLEVLKDADSIKNSIKNIFNWRVGERILNPEFGNTLYEHLYSPMSDVTVKNITASLNKMMLLEPRITVEDIRVIPIKEENQYSVLIVYSIKKLKRREEFQTTLEVLEQ